MKRVVAISIGLVFLGSLACRWIPPGKIARVGEKTIPAADLSCPDRLPESDEQCLALSRLKMRRILFDEMLKQAADVSGSALDPESERQIEAILDRMAPLRERYSEQVRCHAAAALRLLGEQIEIDPECVVDEHQVGELARRLSRRELREAVSGAMPDEMAAAQRENLKAELVLLRIHEKLVATGMDAPAFWEDVYDSLDPVFYDVRYYMGPAEVMTGDPSGWDREQGGRRGVMMELRPRLALLLKVYRYGTV